jgi:hypothetical protein
MMQCVRLPTRWLALLLLGLLSSHGWAQESPPPKVETQEPTPETDRGGLAPSVTPSVAAYPLGLLGLLAPQVRRGGLTLTPSIGVSEEYNDNVDANNQNRHWDFITNFSPSVTLFINQPNYELTAGYSFTAAIYAREPSRDTAFESQNLLASGFYRLTPGLTLNASDAFVLSNYTNVVSAQGISTGRQKSWSNTFAPGATWQMTRLDSLDIGGTYTVLRFEGQGSGIDSDTYGARGIVNHVFTPRLSGNVGYEFTYLAQTGSLPDSATHTPRLGITYQLSRTLTASINGGPAITQIAGDTVVTPAGTASLVQRFSFGSADVQYSRAVTVAGGAGGTNDTQMASATLRVSAPVRGLFVVLGPSYTFTNPIGPAQPGQGEIKAFSLGLSAVYQITELVNFFGGYSYFYQHAIRPSNEADVNQNRVRFGLRFGYPFNFD